MKTGSPDSLQMSNWLRWYTVMPLSSARGVWRGLSSKPDDWLAPGWPRAAGSLKMSDITLWRAARVVPWCWGLVFVGETFVPLHRHGKYMGQVPGCHRRKKVCHCDWCKYAHPAFLSTLCLKWSFLYLFFFTNHLEDICMMWGHLPCRDGSMTSWTKVTTKKIFFYCFLVHKGFCCWWWWWFF